MLASTRKLAGMRDAFLICPDKTIHQKFSYVDCPSIGHAVHRAAGACGPASAAPSAHMVQ